MTANTEDTDTQSIGSHRNADACARSFGRPPGLAALCGQAALAMVRGGLTVTGGRVLFSIVVVAVAGVALVKPAFGWDIIAYAAIVWEDRFTSAAALHAHVYGALKATVSPAGWQDLTNFDDWRRALHANPDYFVSQLGFYRMKFGFIQAISWLGTWTGVLEAGWILAFVFGLGSLALFYRVVMRLELEACVVFLLPVVLASNVQWITRLPSPDAMTCFFVVLGAYCWIYRSHAAAYAAFVLAVVVRPDAIVMVAGLACAQLVAGRFSRSDAAGLALCAIAFVAIKQATGHVGWWPHFYFTNIQYVLDMNAFDIPFRWSLYVGGVLDGVVQTIYKESWAHMYLLLLAVYGAARLVGRKPFDGWDTLILAFAIALGGRIIAFPFLSSRILCPTVLVTGLAVAAHVSAARVELGSAIAGAGVIPRKTGAPTLE